ncbi:MAG: CBS domain-containing protein [Pseudomonadota bacterium]
MADEKSVKDVMIPIEEYEKMDVGARLCDVLSILKRNYELEKAGGKGNIHKTIFITDPSKQIIGKLSVYDLIRGLVPGGARKIEHSKAYDSMLSSRALEVADEVGEFQERFKWLHSTFFDLVKQEAQKAIKDIMSPVHPLLEEEDRLNKAIYIMFKENIRQPLVTRGGKVVGVVDFMGIFDELVEIVGPECNIPY